MRFVLCACVILRFASFVRRFYNIESEDKNSLIAPRYLSDSCTQNGASAKAKSAGSAGECYC